MLKAFPDLRVTKVHHTPLARQGEKAIYSILGFLGGRELPCVVFWSLLGEAFVLELPCVVFWSLLGEAFVLELAGVGFLGAVDTVGGVETRAEDFLFALAVATPHRFDDIV
jgi:hypothetical protein